MDDNDRASQALRKLAELKMKQKGLDKKLEEKGKLKLKQLGINPESAAKSAALMKIMHDASQGRIGQNFGEFDIEGQMTPEERRLKLGWKRNF